jgi:plastocyanin
MKKLIFASFLLLASVSLSACADKRPLDNAPIANEAEKNTVLIENYSFKPAELKIKAGETATWKEMDVMEHTVLGDGGIESPVLKQGDEYKFTFQNKGEFNYHCSIHPNMKGKIIVE